MSAMNEWMNLKSDRLRQKQAFGKKISFADFSLELINNNF